MKLNRLLLGAACTMALTASAADLSFSPGKQAWPPTGSYEGGSSAVLFDLSYSNTFSQNIYSQNELSAIQATVNADGSQEVAAIKGVKLPFYMGYAYGIDGEASITAYLTPYDAASFPENGGKYQWIDYRTESSVKGTAEISAYDDDIQAAAYDEDIVIVSIEFDAPLELTEGGFVLTVVTESSMYEGFGNDYWFMGTYSYKPGVSKCSAFNKSSSSKSGPIASADLSNVLPVVNFTYETIHKEAQGGGEVAGDPAIFNVGDYDGCAGSTTSTGQSLPGTTLAYGYSYSQIIYTPNELNGLASVTAAGSVKADITDVTFKFTDDSGEMLTGMMSGKVYVQKYEGTELPVVDGKSQWVAYDPTVSGTFETEEFFYSYLEDETLELTAKLNAPIRYEEGESLLFTFVMDSSELEGMYGGNDLNQCVYKVQGKQSAVKAADRELDNLSGTADNVSNFVPVLKLGYTPVTVSGGAKPVLFENVEAQLVKATLDPTIVGWGGAKEANAIAISFDLVNASEGEKYDITLGTSNCGTLTGTHGVLSFVGMPQSDLVLSVRPQAEGVLGGSTTIALSDVEALFPVPAVEVAKDAEGKEQKAAYAEYTVWENPGLNNTEPTKKTAVELVAKFKFTTTAPVAVMRGTPADSQVKAVTGNSLPDCFADFVPTGDYSDYAANDGMLSYYLNNANVFSASISKGELVTPANKSITVNFAMDYPLVAKSTPVLGAEAATEVGTKTGFEKTAVSKKYDNGGSWSKESCSANFDFAAGDPEIIVDATYPSSFVMFDDKAAGTLDFYAPEGHTIHINFTPEPEEAAYRVPAMAAEQGADDVEWTPVEGQVYSHAKTDAGLLLIKTKDAEGNDSSTVGAYAISKEGTVTGIESVTVDNAAGEAEYYDLTGRRVVKPAKGVYIVREGNAVRKIAL